MRLVLFEVDPPYQRPCELRRSWRLISLYGVNPLILTQPGWASAWLCTGLQARHSLLAMNQNKAAQSSSPENKLDAWGRRGPHRRILDLHVNGLRPTAWGSEKPRHPDSSLMRAQLPEMAGSPRGSAVKNQPAVEEMQETQVQSLIRDDSLEDVVAARSSTEEPSGL